MNQKIYRVHQINGKVNYTINESSLNKEAPMLGIFYREHRFS